MSKAGFGELCSKGKLDSLGGHGVNVNIFGYKGNHSMPLLSCVCSVNNLSHLTSVSFLNVAYRSRSGKTCLLSCHSKSAIALYFIRFSDGFVLRHSSDGGDHPVVGGSWSA